MGGAWSAWHNRLHPGVAIAPIFLHGRGHYTQGIGGAQAPPRCFLSEEEALWIIQNELATVGLHVSTTPVTTDVKEPLTNPYGLQIPRIPNALTLDAQDSHRNIYLEYVSSSDFAQWAGGQLIDVRMFTGSTAGGRYQYDTHNAAIRTRNKLKETHRQGNYGVVYDPVTTPRYEDECQGILVGGRVYASLSDILYLQLPRIETIDPRKLDDLSEAQKKALGWRWQYETLVDITRLCTMLHLSYHWDADTRIATITDSATAIKKYISIGGPALSKQELRAQLQDFISWLKGQGVI